MVHGEGLESVSRRTTVVVVVPAADAPEGEFSEKVGGVTVAPAGVIGRSVESFFPGTTGMGGVPTFSVVGERERESSSAGTAAVSGERERERSFAGTAAGVGAVVLIGAARDSSIILWGEPGAIIGSDPTNPVMESTALFRRSSSTALWRVSSLETGADAADVEAAAGDDAAGETAMAASSASPGVKIS